MFSLAKYTLHVVSLVSLGVGVAWSQNPTPCPLKPGIYEKAEGWVEIPREGNPVTTFKPNFMHPMLPKTNKEFAGEKAFVTIHNPVQLCAVGTSNGASFSLAKAVAKKGSRTIVQVGDFHSKKEAQSQALAMLNDEQGNIRLMATTLQRGQYILVMIGSFTGISRPSSGNPQADAGAAAMESTTAMALAMVNGNQGMNFGFGIE